MARTQSVPFTTSRLFTIARREIIIDANEIGSETLQHMSILILTGLIYAPICVPATLGVNYLERHFGKYD